ncbi:MAG: F0F1 ATP synthase subunit epsilon [Firmicutes bacterium]|nr:F0F1 ATP synthase subunit epsilon [Bacillota bacterium]
MADKKLELRIIAPGMNLEKKPPAFADMVIVHCITGELGILPGRMPCSMVLGKGALRIHDGETEYRMKIDGGIASVSNDVVTVLSNSVEWE